MRREGAEIRSCQHRKIPASLHSSLYSLRGHQMFFHNLATVLTLADKI